MSACHSARAVGRMRRLAGAGGRGGAGTGVVTAVTPQLDQPIGGAPAVACCRTPKVNSNWRIGRPLNRRPGARGFRRLRAGA